MRFEQGEPDFAARIKYQCEIQSTDDDKIQFVDKILRMLSTEYKASHNVEEIKLRLCLDEALTNAIQHGNKNDPQKKIQIKLLIDDQNLGFAIKDQGEGLKQENLPDVSDWEFLEKSENGRGLMLIENIVDDLTYFTNSKELVFTFRIKSKISE